MNMQTLFTVLHLIVTVLLVVIVLLQEGKDAGMSSITGAAMEDGDSFFSKNSGRTKAAFLSKVTVVLSVMFFVTTIVLVVL